MAKDNIIEVEGVVVDILPNMKFIVELPNGHKVNAYISGRLSNNNIRIILGDKVSVEISTYDLTKGRITYRGTRRKTT